MKNKRLILKKFFPYIAVALGFSTLSMSCDKDDDVDSSAVVIKATGDITSKVNEFRQILGSQLNTTPGAVGGRREINWDGVPPELLNKPLAGDFFNTTGNNVPATRQRGLVYAAGVNNFQVSNDGFKAVNASTAAEFTAFSGNQTFSNVGSNLWDIGFQVPGQPVPATVKGFGLVFSDVDVPNSTFVEFFNETRSIGKFFAPVHDANSHLSFVGVRFNNETITHVKVGHDGTLNDGGKDVSTGGVKDFVVFDDFLFDEPVKNN